MRAPWARREMAVALAVGLDPSVSQVGMNYACTMLNANDAGYIPSSLHSLPRKSVKAYPSKSIPSLSALCTMKLLVFASGAYSSAVFSHASFFPHSAPRCNSNIAASPWPSLIAWCSAVCPSTSVAFNGLFPVSSSAFIIGTFPAAAARCSGN